MQARDLVELAALVATHGPALLAGRGRISNAALEKYWASSKCRLDRWSRALRQFHASTPASEREAAAAWDELRGVLEEILTGEILTRVWCALLAGYDRRNGTRDAEPIARSVFLGHLEARHRTLALLVACQGVTTEAAVSMNRLRHRAERWTDLLLAQLDDCPTNQFAFDPARTEEFAADLAAQRGQSTARRAWALTMAALRAAFLQGLAPSPNSDLNSRIAEGVLACFPAEIFDGRGLVRSLWMTRLVNGALDAQGMVEELLRPEPAAGRAGLEAGTRLPRDFRRFAR